MGSRLPDTVTPETGSDADGQAPDDTGRREGTGERMDDDTLLDLLKTYEGDASDYVTGDLRAARDQAVQEYFQRPYGTEDEGWSQYVGSVVSETVEWMLPDLLDQFVSNDKAVEFQPTRATELEDARDATAGCNHVFYSQNNGFMVLYTAIKDMLTVKTCAVHTFAQTRRRRCRVPFNKAPAMQVAMLQMQYAHRGASIESSTPSQAPIVGPDGRPFRNPDGSPMMQEVFTGCLTYVEESKQVKVEAFEPENLGVARWWTSPILDDCPYVVRWKEVSLSDLNQLADDMGFDRVDPADLSSSAVPVGAFDDAYRRDRTGNMYADARPQQIEGVDRDDESQTMGWLRIEWVLADWDGDGIAERREIWRLENRILSNEECDEVPIATGSPILIPHRWDGQSVAETVSDLQLLDTELMRSVINNAYQASNPRKIAVTDNAGAMLANQSDLLDGRPGGVLRVKGSASNLSLEQTHFVAGDMEPLLQRVDQMREQRTGVTKQRMGMDPNAIRPDRTLGETELINGASKQRTKLIARVMAEVVVKPIFRSILRLLTSGSFDTMFFQLRGKFVQLNPNDWQDHYDLVSNVGLGNGDAESVGVTLKGILQSQMQLATTPIAGLTDPVKIYNTFARLVELGGLRNADEFFTQPPAGTMMPKPPAPPPPYQIQVAQIKAAADRQNKLLDAQLDQARLVSEANMKARDAENALNTQMQNDERDTQRAIAEQQFQDRLETAKLALQKYKVDQDNKVRLYVARLASQDSEDPADMDIDPSTGAPFMADAMAPVVQALQALYQIHSAPKTVVRDANGNITGVQ